MIEVTGRDLAALTHIARNLRPEDRVECLVGSASSPDELAAQTYLAGPLQWTVWRDATPIAVVGAAPLNRHAWSAFAFGTVEWPHAAVTLTRLVLRNLIPVLWDTPTCLRVQALSHHRHAKSHRWLARLGAEYEGTVSAYGSDGSDFLMFAWSRRRMMQGRAAPCAEDPE